MESRPPLPTLISTLSLYERGRGVFDKALSQELQKTSTQVVRKIQPSPFNDAETTPPNELDYHDEQGVNSYTEYSESVKLHGLEEHPLSTSAPGSTRDYQKMRRQSIIAAQRAMPDHIRKFKEEWEYVTENRIKLPLIRQLSPRTRKKVSLLPPPNALDLKKLETFETLAAERAPPTLYSDLNEAAVKEEMNRMRMGIFTMQDCSSKQQQKPHLPSKHMKYDDGNSAIPVSYSSTSYFDDVRERKARKKQQAGRVKLVGGELEEENSLPPMRPSSPVLASYPFHTSLTSLLSRDKDSLKVDSPKLMRSGSNYSQLSLASPDTDVRDHPPTTTVPKVSFEPGNVEEEEANKASCRCAAFDSAASRKRRGGHPPALATTNSVRPGALSTENVALLDTLTSPSDKTVMHNTYDPVLHEATAAANEVVMSYDAVAQAFDKNQQKNYVLKKKEDAFMNQWKSSLLEDIGLDIDPAHNVRVKYGKAITLVLYYLIVVKFKYAIAIWKQFTATTNKVRREKAAQVIGRIGRGMMARRMVTEMRINRQRQHEAEEEYERQRKVFHSYMSRKIARAWWRHKKWQAKKRKRLQHISARTIQRHARGMIGRTYAVWYRLYRDKCVASATLIQSIWWMYKAKRKVTLMRKLEYVRQWELSRAEKLMLQRMKYKHHGAAMTLSRAYRAHTIHVRLQELLYWNRFKLALQIQCVYRGYVVRKMYYRLALAKAKKELSRNNAATLIQSQVRRRNAMRLYFVMTEGKRERNERRKRKKKKKLRDLVISLSEEKEWNVSASNRTIRRYLRSLMPFRYVFERVKARTIQRYWRGYKARKRALIMKVHMKVNDVHFRRERKEKSAVKIQKVFRGHRRRHTMRKEVWRRMATLIQCYWRRRAAKRTVQRMYDRIIARQILSDKLSALVIGNRVRKRYKLEKLYRLYVCRIQRSGRRYIGRKFRRELKDTLRVREEGNGSASLTTLRVMTAIQLMILKECMDREIGVKYRPVCGLQCPCLGPPQALFVSALGKKGRSDPDLLASNRLDTTSALKLVSKVEALYVLDKREKDKRTKEERAILRPVPADATQLMILKAIKVGIIAMPQVVKQLVASDVDIMFNRFKGTSGGNQLLFSEFSEFLGGVGEFAFAKIKLSQTVLPADEFDATFVPEPEKTSRGPSVVIRQTAATNRAPSRAGPTPASDIFTSGASRPPSASTGPSSGTGYRPNSRQGRRKRDEGLSIRAAISKYLYPSENLTVNTGSLGLATLLLMMLATEREDWVKSPYEWLEVESRARACAIIVPIQLLVRRKLARVRMAQRRIEKAEEDHIYAMMSRIRSVQRVMKAKVHWLKSVRLAQMIIIKYVPHKGPPYWYNPRTAVSAYKKPKILGSYDCVEIPLPAPKMEYVIKCGTCEVQPAAVNCNECEDSMCKSCFATMHCKGKKRNHTYQLIQFCSVCKYQNATKSCATCSLRRPKNRSVMELIKGDRGIQCDCCYIHIHENIIASELGSKKNTTSCLRDGTKEAYLVGQALNQRLDTDHRYQSLVQVCEECNWRAATYRCADCDQIYCNKCLTGFHSMGGPFSKHKAEKLPYYTPDMHKKFERAMFEQRLQKRIEKVSQLYARKAHERRVRSAIQIQSWWRMIIGGFKGRAFMKEKRLKIRKMARLRKYEDITYRCTLLYQVRNILGFPPKLASDTVEERILGRHNVFIRQRLREYIWRNCDDWGYFHNISKRRGDEVVIPKLRKGEPRIGFNCGTPKELADQAARGGYRLPGRVYMKRGENTQHLSMDTSMLLKRGQYIRVRNCYFVVNSVGKNNTVTFNRRWRFKDAKDCVMYLMPCYPGEKYKWYYKGKIMLFDVATGNVVSQRLLNAYHWFWRTMSDRAAATATSDKRQGLMVSAKRASKRSEKYHSKAIWASNLIYSDGAPESASLDTGGKSTGAGSKKSRRPEDRIAGEPWEATDDELNERFHREFKMSRNELAAEATLWEEHLDAMKDKPYWLNSETLELTFEMPKAVVTKIEMDAETEKKRQEFAETQRKIARLAKEKAQKKSLGKKK